LFLDFIRKVSQPILIDHENASFYVADESKFVYYSLRSDHIPTIEAIKNFPPLRLLEPVGHNRHNIIPAMLDISQRLNHPVIAKLNDIDLLVKPSDTISQVLTNWRDLQLEQQNEAEIQKLQIAIVRLNQRLQDLQSQQQILKCPPQTD
jgi:hypothetical protein